ncbi:MAG: uroporphyrinogen decarboxylase family protein [Bryobacteraceae bacterium]
MTERERLLAVYRGEVPDRVPFFLDLSHWFYEREKLPFDLSVAVLEPEHELLAYHSKVGAGFYIPNRISYFDAVYPSDVTATVTKEMTPRGPELTWRLETPIGAIQRKRLWQTISYSWNISEWGVRTEQDLRVLAYAMSRLEFRPAWDRYYRMQEAAGDLGVPYVSLGYSGMGHLLHYWMGVEQTIFAAADMPEVIADVVTGINANLLKCIDLLCTGPGEVVLMGDNFSCDVQPPRFIRRWSAEFYREAFRRLRRAGKYSVVHIDGRLSGLLREFAALGVDAIDAVTPAPMGDLTPRQCREEAGPSLILSGGVPPSVWIEPSTDDDFRRAVLDWLEIRKSSPRLVAAAGDQVPPGTPEHRIRMMRDLVETHGRY